MDLQPFPGEQRLNRPRRVAKFLSFPPNHIAVPNVQRYVPGGMENEFLLFADLQPLCDEGWKLHLQLPVGGNLCPLGILCRRGLKFEKVLATSYFAQLQEGREDDQNVERFDCSGYQNVFIYFYCASYF